MYDKFTFNASFNSFLMTIDLELLERSRNAGCPYCGGKLHQADYPRSPMGLPKEQRHNYEERFSLCCRDCRKRTTPRSVRFFGRRWYPAPIHLFICILKFGINERRLQQIKKHFGLVVSRTTWKRWRRWWQEKFIATKFWKKTQGLFSPEAFAGCYPRILFNQLQGYWEQRLILLLRILSPITAGDLRAV